MMRSDPDASLMMAAVSVCTAVALTEPPTLLATLGIASALWCCAIVALRGAGWAQSARW